MMRAVAEMTKVGAEKVDAEVVSTKTGGREEEENTDVVKLVKETTFGDNRRAKQATELVRTSKTN